MANRTVIVSFKRNVVTVLAGIAVVGVVIVLDSLIGIRLGVLRPYATLGAGFVGMAIAVLGVLRQLAATLADDHRDD